MTYKDPFLPNYKLYDEIPQLTKEYVCLVADVKNIEEIPLADINGFLQMLELRDRKILEEYDYEG